MVSSQIDFVSHDIIDRWTLYTTQSTSTHFEKLGAVIFGKEQSKEEEYDDDEEYDDGLVKYLVKEEIYYHGGLDFSREFGVEVTKE